MDKLLKRTSIIMVVLSIIFVFFVLSGQWAQYGSEQAIGIYIVEGVIFFLLCLLFSNAIFKMRDKKDFFLKTEKIDAFWEKRISFKAQYVLVFIIFLFTYTLAFLAVFPGIFGYDGPVQVEQFFSSQKELTAHHPLAHTVFLGGCFWIGNTIFGDYNAGLAIYVIIQNLIMAGIFSYVVVWLRKKGIGVIGQGAALLFFSFNPSIQLLNCNTTKDTLFGGFFLLVFVLFIDLLIEYTKKRAIIFVLASIFMCLFRNQGYYILFFCFLMIFILYRRKKINVCKILLISAMLGWFLMGPLISLLHISKGNPREMLSLPMQQMAAVWKEDELGITVMDPIDKEKLEQLIEPECLSNYSSDTADPVKSGFKIEVLKDDLWGYAKLYIKIGIDHTKSYINSFFKLSSGYWDIYQYGNYRGLMYSNVFPEINLCRIERNSLLPSYYEYLLDMTNCMSRLPVIRIIFSQALPVWMMFFLFGISVRERKKEIGGALLLLFGQWGITLLSPVFLIRYAFPLILCVPVLTSLILKKDINKISLE